MKGANIISHRDNCATETLQRFGVKIGYRNISFREFMSQCIRHFIPVSTVHIGSKIKIDGSYDQIIVHPSLNGTYHAYYY